MTRVCCAGLLLCALWSTACPTPEPELAVSPLSLGADVDAGPPPPASPAQPMDLHVGNVAAKALELEHLLEREVKMLQAQRDALNRP